MSKTLPSIRDAEINTGDVVFVRIDCNVPLTDDGFIADAFRLEAVTPTLSFLKEKGARIIIAGAIGRPKGKRDESLTTKCIAQYFEGRVLDRCHYVDEAIGPVVQDAIAACLPGDGIVLENLRFWTQEETNDEEFAKDLSKFAKIYVNDAFGQSHRNQSSIVAITKFLPSYSGLCLEKEVQALQSVLSDGKSPVVGIIGGAKVSDKLGVIESLLDRCDTILIGGAMAYTFLKGQGAPIGKSLCEDDFVEKTSKWMESGKILLPIDSVVANNFDSEETSITDSIADDQAGFDIGPNSIEIFNKVISDAETILWNGPMGVFEKPQFAAGTQAIGKAVADSSAFSVVGGGDSVAAIREMNLEDKIDHVSTGGGATLEYIETGSLVGVDALINSQNKKEN